MESEVEGDSIEEATSEANNDKEFGTATTTTEGNLEKEASKARFDHDQCVCM